MHTYTHTVLMHANNTRAPCRSSHRNTQKTRPSKCHHGCTMHQLTLGKAAFAEETPKSSPSACGKKPPKRCALHFQHVYSQTRLCLCVFHVLRMYLHTCLQMQRPNGTCLSKRRRTPLYGPRELYPRKSTSQTRFWHSGARVRIRMAPKITCIHTNSNKVIITREGSTMAGKS